MTSLDVVPIVRRLREEAIRWSRKRGKDPLRHEYIGKLAMCANTLDELIAAGVFDDPPRDDNPEGGSQ